MKKIVDKETNRVAFGSYNEPIELNFEDYRLVNFFGKKLSQGKTLRNLKKFNYYSFVNHDKVVSIGIVKLGFINNISAYVHTWKDGIIFDEQINPLGTNKVIYQGDNYNFKVEYVSKKTQVYINKTSNGLIDININFKNKFKCSAKVQIPKGYERAIVCNPADFTKWTFTEKMAGLITKEHSITLNGKPVFEPNSEIICNSDWSAGFFKTKTNWIWASAAAKSGKDLIGFNLTVFINDAQYPESTVWINNKKYIISRVIFDANFLDAKASKIHIYTEDGMLDLNYEIAGTKTDIRNRLNIVKTNFHQYVGSYSGTIKVDNKVYKINDALGCFEFNKTVW